MIKHSYKLFFLLLPVLFLQLSCSKSNGGGTVTPPSPATFSFSALKVNGIFSGYAYQNVSKQPVLKFSFSAPIDKATVGSSISFTDKAGTSVTYNSSYENSDSTVVIQPAANLGALNTYTVTVSTALRSANTANLLSAINVRLLTAIDSSRKFPIVSDNALLDIIQQQTFKYFYDYGHPVSGLARERSGTSNSETITIGGSGFGVMALITGVNRSFITRAQGLARMQMIVGFLKNLTTFHGAYPHWLNGSTGAVIPFSANDNGADLVETSYLMEGLLCARQYFNGADPAETTLRTDINVIWNKVEWDWFRQNNQNVLYWHWSPDKLWAINMKIQGWNETLMTYVLGASSTTHNIPKVVYTNGWTNNNSAPFKNGNTYFGYTLPLGPDKGGPLFFEHYSFLGINPNGLTDEYSNSYATQTKNHTLINYSYCRANSNGYGYSDSTWGLTASDIPNGYTASSPTNDVGVIAPTAAISSLPYTPAESMAALKFDYYVLGDKIFKQYGFVDAFSLKDQWFADSFLAIDQGPIIVMIENYRSQLLWNLFTSCPEVKTGMLSLGFTAPYL